MAKRVDDVEGVHRRKRTWTLLEVVMGLYHYFIHETAIQDATERFETTCGCRRFANPMASTQKTICKLYGHLDTEAWHRYGWLYGISAQFQIFQI